MIFTFWEGPMPEYVKMCMETWKFDFTVLTFDTIDKYTELDVRRLREGFTLPQISDAVRAHVLRDNGGYWLDADTIMLGTELPKENIIGDPITRIHSTGVSHWTEEAAQFFIDWSKYQDKVIVDSNHSNKWSVLVNMFTDEYVAKHKEVTIYPIEKCRPELALTRVDGSKKQYERFYFECLYHLSDIHDADLLVLHNSWTPDYYKALTRKQILADRLTISNILREVI